MVPRLPKVQSNSINCTRTSIESTEHSRRDALNRVLRSSQFEKSARASQFLRYIVDETIAGRANRLKGYTIATDVFGRGADFDSDNDTIVRVQAGQIRRRLSLYYADEGQRDPIQIELPKGGYEPLFLQKVPDANVDAPDTSSGMSVSRLTLPRGPSIAVLPFDNLSADNERDYLAEGIAEEIINDLTKFRDLLVVARRTTFRYRGESVDIHQVGEDLGVEYVLSGSVRSAGARIRVSAQLVDAASNINVFSDQYNRELTPKNVLDVQEEISNKVVAKIAEPYGVIARLGQHRSRRIQSSNIDSYGCVLRYYRFEAAPTAEEHALLRDLLEEATEKDPEYASAWAALSAIYLDEARFNLNPKPERPALPLALDAAERAVSIDPESSMAHHFLFTALFHTGDLRGFAEAGDRAIRLNPNHPDMLADLGTYRAISGDWDGGLPLARKAIAISVFPPGWYHCIFSLNHYRLNRLDEALNEALQVRTSGLSADPLLRTICHAQLGNHSVAQSSLAELESLFPEFCANARDFFAFWNFEPALRELVIDGLRKAGGDL